MLSATGIVGAFLMHPTPPLLYIAMYRSIRINGKDNAFKDGQNVPRRAINFNCTIAHDVNGPDADGRKSMELLLNRS